MLGQMSWLDWELQRRWVAGRDSQWPSAELKMRLRLMMNGRVVCYHRLYFILVTVIVIVEERWGTLY
jgi:hypothetical protein